MSHEYKNILVVAGEASGDMHAASLVAELKRLAPRIRFYGVGGARLRAAGVRLVADAADMAVVGLTEVFAKLPFIRKVMGKLKASLAEEKPDLVILVDYPDFNLILAKAAHRRGIKVLYYISPQVWAWRKGRIGKIGRYVDHMAVILPFELPLYEKAGVRASFVGHPLLDMMPAALSVEEARERIGLKGEKTTLAILPGSRPGEVERLLPICLKAAEIMNRERELRFVLPLAGTLSVEFVEGIIARQGVEVTVVRDRYYEALRAADLAVIASGTATLEAALMETPMIIIYRVSRLTYALGRLFISLKNIGLANIISGRTIVPELIQRDAVPEKIARLGLDLLADPAGRDAIREGLKGVKSLLGSPGAAERTSQIAFAMIGGHTGPEEVR